MGFVKTERLEWETPEDVALFDKFMRDVEYNPEEVKRSAARRPVASQSKIVESKFWSGTIVRRPRQRSPTQPQPKKVKRSGPTLEGQQANDMQLVVAAKSDSHGYDYNPLPMGRNPTACGSESEPAKPHPRIACKMKDHQLEGFEFLWRNLVVGIPQVNPCECQPKHQFHEGDADAKPCCCGHFCAPDVQRESMQCRDPSSEQHESQVGITMPEAAAAEGRSSIPVEGEHAQVKRCRDPLVEGRRLVCLDGGGGRGATGEDEVQDGLKTENVIVNQEGECRSCSCSTMGVRGQNHNCRNGCRRKQLNSLISHSAQPEVGGCILAHAPGSGKTLQAISFIEQFFTRKVTKTDSSRVVVIVPKNVLVSWKQEFKKWLPEGHPLLEKIYLVSGESPLHAKRKDEMNGKDGANGKDETNGIDGAKGASESLKRKRGRPRKEEYNTGVIMTNVRNNGNVCSAREQAHNSEGRTGFPTKPMEKYGRPRNYKVSVVVARKAVVIRKAGGNDDSDVSCLRRKEGAISGDHKGSAHNNGPVRKRGRPMKDKVKEGSLVRRMDGIEEGRSQQPKQDPNLEQVWIHCEEALAESRKNEEKPGKGDLLCRGKEKVAAPREHKARVYSNRAMRKRGRPRKHNPKEEGLASGIDRIEESRSRQPTADDSLGLCGLRDKAPAELVTYENEIEKWYHEGGVLIITPEKWTSSTVNKKPTADGEKVASMLLHGPHVVFVDEGHRARNDTTGLSKSLQSLRTPRKVLLTGTPFNNNMGEFTNQLYLVRPSMVGRILAKWQAGCSWATDVPMPNVKERAANVASAKHPATQQCTPPVSDSPSLPTPLPCNWEASDAGENQAMLPLSHSAGAERREEQNLRVCLLRTDDDNMGGKGIPPGVVEVDNRALVPVDPQHVGSHSAAAKVEAIQGYDVRVLVQDDDGNDRGEMLLGNNWPWKEIPSQTLERSGHALALVEYEHAGGVVDAILPKNGLAEAVLPILQEEMGLGNHGVGNDILARAQNRGCYALALAGSHSVGSHSGSTIAKIDQECKELPPLLKDREGGGEMVPVSKGRNGSYACDSGTVAGVQVGIENADKGENSALVLFKPRQAGNDNVANNSGAVQDNELGTDMNVLSKETSSGTCNLLKDSPPVEPQRRNASATERSGSQRRIIVEEDDEDEETTSSPNNNEAEIPLEKYNDETSSPAKDRDVNNASPARMGNEEFQFPARDRDPEKGKSGRRGNGQVCAIPDTFWKQMERIIEGDRQDDEWQGVVDDIARLKELIKPFVYFCKISEGLPPLHEVALMVKLTDEQKDQMNEAKKNCLNTNTKGMCGKGEENLESRISIHAKGTEDDAEDDNSITEKSRKLAVLFELIKFCEGTKERILVFLDWRIEGRLLEMFSKYSLTEKWAVDKEILVIHGETASDKRHQLADHLNDMSSYAKIMFLMVQAGGEGITLTGASRVVLLGVHWNPSVQRQAVARAHRIGQKRTVHVYQLISDAPTELIKFKKACMKQKLNGILTDNSLDTTVQLRDRDSQVVKRDDFIEVLLQKGLVDVPDIHYRVVRPLSN
ncbi:hypothetical protein CBR_g28037 [Chara braunii]|uniref:Uncharacterized protein n=1 Tax=Chara braunii TaxID=69332 RepID=A0A388L9E6_CHABU|nr:hypothetical protein CBR_g28037 [Chara braunii]|eukprot:GBG78813.1 hypothetical protein CBR_g28037 [Chara braunii]